GWCAWPGAARLERFPQRSVSSAAEERFIRDEALHDASRGARTHSMISKSWGELQKMHRACRIVVEALEVLARAAAPGVTTRELDRIARDHIVKAGARPAFLGYRGYPATLCISVNEEVVHGIPGDRRLQDGDVVGLDLGCVVDGFYGDAARTVGVGRVSDEARRLMSVTEEALHA